MQRGKIRQIVFPLITAFIFGSSFVVQSLASGQLGCFTLNWTRSLLSAGGLFLLLCLRRRAGKGGGTVSGGTQGRSLLRAGLVVGTLLTVSCNLQQYGIAFTSAGKAGFVTALYIVIVPILGLFFRKRVRLLVWVAVLLACGGIYFLCVQTVGSLQLQKGDLFVLASAFTFSLHILAIDHYAKDVGFDGLCLSCAQFAVACVECLICALLFEGLPFAQILLSARYILYMGLVCGGVGYTLQILAQAEGEAVIVSLLLSLESLFAVLCGAIILHERLSGRETFGCALMLLAVVLVQLPEKKSAASA